MAIVIIIIVWIILKIFKVDYLENQDCREKPVSIQNQNEPIENKLAFQGSEKLSNQNPITKGPLLYRWKPGIILRLNPSSYLFTH